MLLIIVALSVDYLLGPAFLYAHEPPQGSIDEKAEFDGNEAGDGSDSAMVQCPGPDPLPLLRDSCQEAIAYPRDACVSGVFRPPSAHV